MLASCGSSGAASTAAAAQAPAAAQHTACSRMQPHACAGRAPRRRVRAALAAMARAALTAGAWPCGWSASSPAPQRHQHHQVARWPAAGVATCAGERAGVAPSQQLDGSYLEAPAGQLLHEGSFWTEDSLQQEGQLLPFSSSDTPAAGLPPAQPPPQRQPPPSRGSASAPRAAAPPHLQASEAVLELLAAAAPSDVPRLAEQLCAQPVVNVTAALALLHSAQAPPGRVGAAQREAAQQLAAALVVGLRSASLEDASTATLATLCFALGRLGLYDPQVVPRIEARSLQQLRAGRCSNPNQLGQLAAGMLALDHRPQPEWVEALLAAGAASFGSCNALQLASLGEAAAAWTAGSSSGGDGGGGGSVAGPTAAQQLGPAGEAAPRLPPGWLFGYCAALERQLSGTYCAHMARVLSAAAALLRRHGARPVSLLAASPAVSAAAATAQQKLPAAPQGGAAAAARGGAAAAARGDAAGSAALPGEGWWLAVLARVVEILPDARPQEMCAMLQALVQLSALPARQRQGTLLFEQELQQLQPPPRGRQKYKQPPQRQGAPALQGSRSAPQPQPPFCSEGGALVALSQHEQQLALLLEVAALQVRLLLPLFTGPDLVACLVSLLQLGLQPPDEDEWRGALLLRLQALLTRLGGRELAQLGAVLGQLQRRPHRQWMIDYSARLRIEAPAMSTPDAVQCLAGLAACRLKLDPETLHAFVVLLRGRLGVMHAHELRAAAAALRAMYSPQPLPGQRVQQLVNEMERRAAYQA